MSATRKGGEFVCDTLVSLGVRSVFAIAGASHTHVLAALQKNDVSIISNRHETGAVGAADGYARVSGKLGVALIIAEQGLPNAMCGIASAYHACSPVLVLIARLPSSWTESQSEWDADKHDLVSGVTKWARTVPSAERLSEYVWTAAKAAQSGRRGPVALTIPVELLAQPVSAPLHNGGAAPAISHPSCAAGDAVVAAKLIANAERPLIVAGAGARWAGASGPLQKLHDEFGIPVLGNGLGRGLVPENWKTSFSWPFGQLGAKHADCVIVAGARLKQRLGFGLPARFSPSAKFIQIDLHAEELHRNRPADVAFHGDAAATLTAIVDALGRQSPQPKFESTWLRDHLQERFDKVREEKARSGERVHPLVLGEALQKFAPDDLIYVGDGADIQAWLYNVIAIREAPGHLDHYPMGAMGIGMPLAVGAAVAARDGDGRRVVLVTGDGSFGFYPAELHAAARANLPLVVIIANDGAWGSEFHEQKTSTGKTFNTELGYHRYEKIAEAFGCESHFVAEPSELEPALERAFAATGPVVVNVVMDQNAGAALRKTPILKTIVFDDLASSQKSFGTPGDSDDTGEGTSGLI